MGEMKQSKTNALVKARSQSLGQIIYRTKSHKKEGKGITQEGIVFRVGVGYVDLLQNDHTITKILTNRIKNITWVDRNCNYECFHGLNLECNRRNHHLHCSKCQHQHRDCQCHDHENYCSQCHHHHDSCSCHDHRSDCSTCHRPHRDCRCHHKEVRIHDHVIPFCDERIQLRLAGLTDNLNFKLFRHLGCKVVLELL